MTYRTAKYRMGQQVLVLCLHGHRRAWMEGRLVGVQAKHALVDLGGPNPARVPLSRVRAAEVIV